MFASPEDIIRAVEEVFTRAADEAPIEILARVAYFMDYIGALTNKMVEEKDFRIRLLDAALINRILGQIETEVGATLAPINN